MCSFCRSPIATIEQFQIETFNKIQIEIQCELILLNSSFKAIERCRWRTRKRFNVFLGCCEEKNVTDWMFSLFIKSFYSKVVLRRNFLEVIQKNPDKIDEGSNPRVEDFYL